MGGLRLKGRGKRLQGGCRDTAAVTVLVVIGFGLDGTLCEGKKSIVDLNLGVRRELWFAGYAFLVGWSLGGLGFGILWAEACTWFNTFLRYVVCCVGVRFAKDLVRVIFQDIDVCSD